MESAPPLTAEILMRHEACVLRLARTLVRSAAVAEIAKSSLGWPTAIGAGLALEAIAVSPEQCTLAWRTSIRVRSRIRTECVYRSWGPATSPRLPRSSSP
jgi:hypothetical protein